MAQWRNEKAIIDLVRAAQEKIETLKGDTERAQRIGDLTRASQITYGDLPEAHRELEAAKEQLAARQTQARCSRRKSPRTTSPASFPRGPAFP